MSCAICWAAGQSDTFRNPITLQVIAGNLKKTKKRRQAALEAVANIPGLAAEHWPEIINGIDDDDPGVRRAASQAAVQAGINAELVVMTASKKDVLLRALRLFAETAGDQQLYSARVKHETLERMLDSGERRNRLVSIGLLPMADESPRYAYERLISILNEREDREEIVAALMALSYGGDVLSLLTVGDLKLVIQWMGKGTLDVRIAAMRLLGSFGRTITAVHGLLQLSPNEMVADEYAAYMATLGGARVLREEVLIRISSEADRLLDPAIKMNKDNIRRVSACLDALRRLEQNVSGALMVKIEKLVDNYRIEQEVRSRALLCLPAIALPSSAFVRRLTTFFERRLPEFELDLVQVPSILATKCRQSVDYVIASVPALPELRDAAIRLHKRIAQREATAENEFRVTELRNGIDEINNIIIAFEEFITK